MELKQYFRIIVKKWWLIAAIVVIAVAATGVKSLYLTTPVYEANAKLIVNQSASADGGAGLNAGTIQTSIFLINSYKEIIKSSAIMDKVVQKYPDLKASPGELAAMISVTSANNSQVMNLVYQDPSYTRAAKIVNAVSTVFKEQIPRIMNVDNITILSEADTKASPGPININPVMNMLISFVVSLMLAVGLVFLLDYLDDTVRTEAEASEILDMPVLAVISEMNRGDLKTRSGANIPNQKVGDGKYATLNQ
ncbi:YveK family protein [Paenibacillus sp. XY044]|uniref:YveK family protein n=1 Tax=Paenibacillus sp. XY044 TaxID=2026089 RepID=UPI000B999384|nr:Wzz/FepE/Etk N-terminal domain-containing protein [Paenibacillus sp. XY044]OZB96618.1 lipopolysaccharide biosynthesis protein [Paenibacillus sp. XY044]